MDTADTAMAEAALYRLLAWLSPSFPVGSYTYSHGLETAIEDGLLTDRKQLVAWVEALVSHGSGRNDAIYLAHVWRAACAEDDDAVQRIAESSAALFATAELKLESTQQGAAFRDAVRRAWPAPGLDRLTAIKGPLTYPVAVGITAAAHMVPLQPTLHAFVHGFVANLVSASVRLVPLGQTDGQKALAKLEKPAAAAAREAETATLSEIGGATWMSDILSMRHETQRTRLFRS